MTTQRKYTKPRIQWEHVDGPVLIYSDGQLHWLTWREKIACLFAFTDAETLQKKHRPEL